MDRPLLPPGHWYDDQADPLHTKEDVEELFRIVNEKEAEHEATDEQTGTETPEK